MNLLEKTRKITSFIQNQTGPRVEFDHIAKILGEVIECNVYIFSSKGKTLGYSLLEPFEYELLDKDIIQNRYFPEENEDWLLNIDETTANYKPEEGPVNVDDDNEYVSREKVITIIPIKGGGKRLGTLVLAKLEGSFSEDDLILGEYGSTVIAMEILRSESNKIEKEIRKKAEVQIALETLSYSELEALEGILNELGKSEGLIVAGKVADEIGITRSVIVNALRKMESAGVIESRSLGMKGTYIKVLNERLFDELEKAKI